MGLSQAQKIVGKESSVIRAPDEVSTSDIRHYREIVEGEKESWDTSAAPPTMIMAWAMEPLWPEKVKPTEPHEQVLKLLDDAGYGGTMGISLDQECIKPVRLGDQLSFKVMVVSVSSSEEEAEARKGYMVTLLYTFTNQKGEVVSTQTYTILKFKTLAQSS